MAGVLAGLVSGELVLGIASEVRGAGVLFGMADGFFLELDVEVGWIGVSLGREGRGRGMSPVFLVRAERSLRVRAGT